MFPDPNDLQPPEHRKTDRFTICVVAFLVSVVVIMIGLEYWYANG